MCRRRDVEGQCHETTTVETRVIQLQAKKHRSLLAAVRCSGEARRVLSSRSRGDCGPADTLTSACGFQNRGTIPSCRPRACFYTGKVKKHWPFICSMAFGLGLSDVVLMIGSRSCTWDRKAMEAMPHPQWVTSGRPR